MSVFHTSTTPIPMRLYENKIIVCTNFVLNFYQTMIYRTYYLSIERVELTHSSNIH